MTTSSLVLNRLFTQNVFQDLINNNKNTVYDKIAKQYVGELLNEIYGFMSKSYRNEYFYQNTLLNKLPLGRHSIKTTTALTQISIGKLRKML